MDRVELTKLAEEMLEEHEQDLLIDPFIQIKIEVTEGSFTSNCIKGPSPMSWIIQLNPEKHNSIFNIQYSILESLFLIIFDDLKLATDKSSQNEIQGRIIARLTSAFCEIFSNDEEKDSEEDFEDED